MNLESVLHELDNGQWSCAHSRRWYQDDWYQDLVTDDSLYRTLMLKSENKLLKDVRDHLGDDKERLSVVDLGPGDGEKIDLLFKDTQSQGNYVPIDVNESQLEKATERNADKFNDASPLHGEFRDCLREAIRQATSPALWYLGATMSNIDAFEYDVVREITHHLRPGDTLYASTQTLHDPDIIPYLIESYADTWPSSLSLNMAEEVGVTPTSYGVDFSTQRQRIQASVKAGNVSGAAKDKGMEPGDDLITYVSLKPRSLQSYVESRFPDVMERCTGEYITHSEPFENDGDTYTNSFEGLLLTKTSSILKTW